MKQYSFRVLNVFTRPGERLSGNPLAVFTASDDIDAATMQALARQMNLAETTFVLKSSRANARVRIFTPAYEMPFAGHPTLGTAHVCRAIGLGGNDLKLEMAAGVIAVRAQGDDWTLQAPRAKWREVSMAQAEVADLVGLAESDIAERPLWVSAGREQLIVPLASEAAVRRAEPKREAFARLECEDDPGQVYVFAPLGPGKILARFFFPDGKTVREDPATGSATANLGGWLLATKHPLPARLVASQGEVAGRPSSLTLDVDSESRIFVTGTVVELAKGTLDL
jgi:trans-2,3-dihydro-3-hydroxyanthranilate isomerase